MESYEFYDRQCVHDASNVVIDQTSGTEVCTECGRVLKDQIFVSSNASQHNGLITSADRPHSKYNTYAYNDLLQQCVNLIDEVCEKYNISNQTMHTCKRMVADKAHTLTHLNVQKVSAFCFFKSTQDDNSSIRTKNEICQMFQITPKYLQDSTNKYDTSKNQIDVTKPSDILPRVTFSPSISFKDKQDIALAADSFYKKVNASPAAVLAYTIYTHCNVHLKTKVSMSYVAKLCNVSTTSIKRLCKKTRQMTKNK